MASAARYVGAIDHGTTSTRFIVFDHDGRIVASEQLEHEQLYPHPGWVEHDPKEIVRNTLAVVEGGLRKAQLAPSDLCAVGITNQRETVVMWDKATGEPVYNAIVWMDARTSSICDALAKEGGKGKDRFRDATGLPISTYFSASKLTWLLDNVPGVRARAERGELLAGTTDTWLLWNLTGGVDGGAHITDVTNASRTLLLNLHSLRWDEDLLRAFRVPACLLPAVRSSSEVYGHAVAAPLQGVPIAGILGDQQAALFGQTCFSPGEAKNTYGTGTFFLKNVGTTPVPSTRGLLTTVAYQLGDAPPVYALEGGVAIAGALVQWLRDNLGLIKAAPEVEVLARGVPDNGGVYFVPAFSGLYAPHWRTDARGVVAGLTRFANKHHIARAALEATAYQTRELVEAMVADSGFELTVLKVDGGMVVNSLLMQFQSDILNAPVVRPHVSETTALGAAYSAGLAVGFWASLDELRARWAAEHTWEPSMAEEERERLFGKWQKAVQRTLEWE